MGAINPTNFDEIPTFPEKKKERKENVVHAIIETAGQQRHKYAFEPKFGLFVLASTLAEGLAWPYDYGFIPQTLGEDGDPLDLLFLDDEPTFAGCLVKARILGIIHLVKNGEENDRILGCAMRLPGVAQTTDRFDDVKDMPAATIRGLCRFLVEYSEEQGNDIEFKGVDGVAKAFDAIDVGMKAFKKSRKQGQ